MLNYLSNIPLGRALDTQLLVTICGNASNVRSLFKRSKADNDWENAYFVEDGDNENTPFPDETRFIHLQKYGIENYLFDLDISSAVTGKNVDELRQIIFQAVVDRKDRILGKSKFLEFLIDQLQPEHLTVERLAKLDASLIFPQYLRAIDETLEGFVEKYVAEAKRQGTLNKVFPDQLIEAVNRGI